MSAYRFCRTDDVALLVDALNRCWSPAFPGDPPATPASFKQSIRDLQVWSSSCMVAFSGPDPIGVLIGAKRPGATLVHRIAIHPDHRRQGHGRHLLASLSSKLAILGPRRLVAEVPDTFDAACGLFSASGYAQAALLTDYVLQHDGEGHGRGATAPGAEAAPPGDARATGFLIPITVDDLAANGLLEEEPLSAVASQGPDQPHMCWERSVDTLTARKDAIAGLAIASDERIEASVLYVDRGAEGTEIVSLRSFIEDGGARLAQLLSHLRARGSAPVRFPKVHPAEIPREWLHTLGFRAAGGHLLFAANAASS